MTFSPSEDNHEREQSTTPARPPALRWKERTHLNFVAGRSRLRALPVVVHLLRDDIDWFAQDPSLFDELKGLLRDRVISATNGGDKDPEATKSRKRARKEELCVQGERVQFTYRYRRTLPRYTVLDYAGEDVEGNQVNRNSANPGFRHLPLSESTLLVWVYRFDIDNPYATVPNEAALQFAPPAKLSQALNLETVRPDSRAATGSTNVQGGPRDAGILAWLWGGDKMTVAESRGGGGVRQHFIGSAAWQGRPETAQGRDEEDDDIQRAIALSLAVAAGTVTDGQNADQDAVQVVDDDVGVEESKGGN